MISGADYLVNGEVVSTFTKYNLKELQVRNTVRVCIVVGCVVLCCALLCCVVVLLCFVVLCCFLFCCVVYVCCVVLCCLFDGRKCHVCAYAHISFPLNLTVWRQSGCDALPGVRGSSPVLHQPGVYWYPHNLCA